LTSSKPKPAFVDTRQHQRFVDFCNACRHNQYIGVCTGRSGIGKTRSAVAYSNWHIIEPLLKVTPGRNPYPPPELEAYSTAIYTPNITCTVKRVESELAILRNRFDALVEHSMCWHNPEVWYKTQRHRFLELIIIDKAQRLSLQCLEAIADFGKTQKFGIALIGLPGFDRRIRNYEPIGNAVGFYHVFNTPRIDELRAILEARWHCQQITIEDSAVHLLAKVTNSNIQKLVNLNSEISRVCTLNSITIITPDLVQLASKTLLLDTV
jgi:DNA transposition AAA+ family ATPase